MKVYVASKFERVPQVREIQERLKRDGHVIVADWTSHSAAGKRGEDLVRYLQSCAENDAQGVADADAIVLLHDDNCRGGFTELGIAIGYNMALARAGVASKIVAVIGGRVRAPDHGPIFYFQQYVRHFDTAEAAAEYLKWADTKFAEPPKIVAEPEDLT